MVRNVHPNPYDNLGEDDWWHPQDLSANQVPSILSASQVDQFRHDGFVVVTGLWPVDLIMQAAVEARELHPFDDVVDARGGFSEMPWVHKREDAPDVALNHMTIHPRALAAVSQLMERPVLDLRLSQSHVIAKYGHQISRPGEERDGTIAGDQDIHVDYGNNTLMVPPHRTRAALSEYVVFGAKQQVRQQRAADAVVPRLRALGKHFAPHLANVLDVVRVVHVQSRQHLLALGCGDALQIDHDRLGARGPVELALATEYPGGGRERADEGSLVLGLGVLDKGGPVDLAEPLAHATLEPDARLGLREQRAPALRGADAAYLLDGGARGADVLRAAAAEPEQGQRVPWLHLIALGALLAPRRSRSTDATRSRAWLLLALVGAASAHPIAPCVGDCSANASASRVTRRLTVTTVQPGVNLQTVVDNASPGDEIVLGDACPCGSAGTYAVQERRLIRAFRTAYKRMSFDAPASTLTTNSGVISSDVKGHPVENRVLSVREILIAASVSPHGSVSYRWWEQVAGIFEKLPHTFTRDVIGESIPPLALQKIVSHLLNSKEDRRKLRPITARPR